MDRPWALGRDLTVAELRSIDGAIDAAIAMDVNSALSFLRTCKFKFEALVGIHARIMEHCNSSANPALCKLISETWCYQVDGRDYTDDQEQESNTKSPIVLAYYCLLQLEFDGGSAMQIMTPTGDSEYIDPDGKVISPAEYVEKCFRGRMEQGVFLEQYFMKQFADYVEANPRNAVGTGGGDGAELALLRYRNVTLPRIKACQSVLYYYRTLIRATSSCIGLLCADSHETRMMDGIYQARSGDELNSRLKIAVALKEKISAGMLRILRKPTGSQLMKPYVVSGRPRMYLFHPVRYMTTGARWSDCITSIGGKDPLSEAGQMSADWDRNGYAIQAIPAARDGRFLETGGWVVVCECCGNHGGERVRIPTTTGEYRRPPVCFDYWHHYNGLYDPMMELAGYSVDGSGDGDAAIRLPHHDSLLHVFLPATEPCCQVTVGYVPWDAGDPNGGTGDMLSWVQRETSELEDPSLWVLRGGDLETSRAVSLELGVQERLLRDSMVLNATPNVHVYSDGVLVADHQLLATFFKCTTPRFLPYGDEMMHKLYDAHAHTIRCYDRAFRKDVMEFDIRMEDARRTNDSALRDRELKWESLFPAPLSDTCTHCGLPFDLCAIAHSDPNGGRAPAVGGDDDDDGDIDDDRIHSRRAKRVRIAKPVGLVSRSSYIRLIVSRICREPGLVGGFNHAYDSDDSDGENGAVARIYSLVRSAVDILRVEDEATSTLEHKITELEALTHKIAVSNGYVPDEVIVYPHEPRSRSTIYQITSVESAWRMAQIVPTRDFDDVWKPQAAHFKRPIPAGGVYPYDWTDEQICADQEHYLTGAKLMIGRSFFEGHKNDSYQVFLLFYGMAQSGKSLTQEFWRSFFCLSEVAYMSKATEKTFGYAKVSSSFITFLPEGFDNEEFGEFVKSLVSGDGFSAPQKNKDTLDFHQLKANLSICTNRQMRMCGVNDQGALSRRTVPCLFPVSATKRSHDLKSRMLATMHGHFCFAANIAYAAAVNTNSGDLWKLARPCDRAVPELASDTSYYRYTPRYVARLPQEYRHCHNGGIMSFLSTQHKMTIEKQNSFIVEAITKFRDEPDNYKFYIDASLRTDGNGGLVDGFESMNAGTLFFPSNYGGTWDLIDEDEGYGPVPKFAYMHWKKEDGDKEPGLSDLLAKTARGKAGGEKEIKSTLDNPFLYINALERLGIYVRKMKLPMTPWVSGPIYTERSFAIGITSKMFFRYSVEDEKTRVHLPFWWHTDA